MKPYFGQARERLGWGEDRWVSAVPTGRARSAHWVYNLEGRMKTRPAQRVALRDHPGVNPETLRSLGIPQAEVLDLASGLNRYGPPDSVLAAARAASLADYPDPTASAARARIARELGCAPAAVVIGNGTADLLWTCARVLLGPGTALLAIEPCYPELSTAARQSGARVVRWRSVERTGHCVDLQQVGELMLLERPDVVGLCAPGSPTGSSVRFGELELLAARFPDSYFVVDQTFLSLSDDHADLLRSPPANVICVRSLSKPFGLPGVRAGYLLADPSLAEQLEASRPAFSICAAAQAVAEAAAGERAFLESCRLRLQADRARLLELLDELGLVYTPTVAPFALLRLERASEVARELLERHHIAVHDATPYGLPDHLRISAPDAAGSLQLEAALVECTTRRQLDHGRES